jgi:hypothetical protein
MVSLMVADILSSHIWVILKAKHGTMFYTSDNPFAKKPNIKHPWVLKLRSQSPTIFRWYFMRERILRHTKRKMGGC